MELLSKLRRVKALRGQRSGSLLSGVAATLIAALFIGCTNDPEPAPDGGGPVVKGSASYTMYAHNFRDVRSGESVHLWAKYKGDSTWSWMTMLKMPRLYGNDSSRLAGRYKFTREIGDLEKLLVSIEVVDSPSAPTAKLAAGAIVNNTAFLRSEDIDGVGDYSAVTGSVIFTSNSDDSLRYLQEFYFARLENGQLVPSITELPALPQGWNYAIWVSDSNFFPLHKFFYGYLESPSEPDTRNAKDTYPLPGGFEGLMLNRDGGQVFVTLEPPTMQANLQHAGPSPYNVIFAALPKKIERYQTLEMFNVDHSSLPVIKFVLRPDQ